jgi:hypothetical protein
MHNFVLYLVVSSICITIVYGFFKVFIDNRISFVLMRFFLLTAIVFSLLLPFHTFRIDLGISNSSESIQEKTETLEIENTAIEKQIINQTQQTRVKEADTGKRLSSWMLIKYIYFIVMGFLLFRLVLNLSRIFYLRIICNIQNIGKDRIIVTNQISNSFSFFRWIFLNKEGKSESEIQNIILHEKIHASQYHSIDLLLMELVIVFMWFNPVVWIMRKLLQQTHEYLADEGVLNTGVSKPEYKAHLLNQVAEERLIALSSGFNHSLIKKRIVMMTKPKFGQQTNLRFLTILPLTILLFTGVACINGQKTDGEKKTVAAVAPTKMNVLYLGLDNPMSIAVSGYDASELRVEVDSNGRILGENGSYIIRPIRPGTLKIFVYADNNLVSETHFRVKTVPDPVVKVAGKKGGTISKEELLNAGKVIVDMENFDFDLSFDIAEFTVAAVIEGYVEEYKSTSATFTKEQVDLIEKLKPEGRVYIQEIKARGPDGALRALNTIVFKIE